MTTELTTPAVGAGLLVHTADPLNAETPLGTLIEQDPTPADQFYVRNHFAIPKLPAADWRLEVGGRVLRRQTYDLAQLYALQSQTRVVTLECAGNNRSALTPPAPGPQWGLGAAGSAEWTGVPLLDVLARAGPAFDACEIVFRGADHGHVDGHAGTTFFERCLSLDQVAAAGALLAYALNGAPLPRQHGYPLRLVVPGWYGMASVKWLTEIEVIDHSFHGHFQTEKYRYEWLRDGQAVVEPVRQQRVRAIIAEPVAGQRLTRDHVMVRGLAWSGVAPISQVWVSVGQRPWQRARLVDRAVCAGWQRWELLVGVNQPGTTTVRACAVDCAGRMQPVEPEWNRLGYGANGVQTVTIQLT
jgi:DMSO/TMAO reductase YedYZ molybdopterin-dependent catalytic subunit